MMMMMIFIIFLFHLHHSGIPFFLFAAPLFEFFFTIRSSLEPFRLCVSAIVTHSILHSCPSSPFLFDAVCFAESLAYCLSSSSLDLSLLLFSSFGVSLILSCSCSSSGVCVCGMMGGWMGRDSDLKHDPELFRPLQPLPIPVQDLQELLCDDWDSHGQIPSEKVVSRSILPSIHACMHTSIHSSIYPFIHYFLSFLPWIISGKIMSLENIYLTQAEQSPILGNLVISYYQLYFQPSAGHHHHHFETGDAVENMTGTVKGGRGRGVGRSSSSSSSSSADASPQQPQQQSTPSGLVVIDVDVDDDDVVDNHHLQNQHQRHPSSPPQPSSPSLSSRSGGGPSSSPPASPTLSGMSSSPSLSSPNATPQLRIHTQNLKSKQLKKKMDDDDGGDDQDTTKTATATEDMITVPSSSRSEGDGGGLGPDYHLDELRSGIGIFAMPLHSINRVSTAAVKTVAYTQRGRAKERKRRLINYILRIESKDILDLT